MTDEQGGHWETISVFDGVPTGTRVRATYTVGGSDDHARERWVPDVEPGIYVASHQVFQVGHAPGAKAYRAVAFETVEALPLEAVRVADLAGNPVSQPIPATGADWADTVTSEVLRQLVNRLGEPLVSVNAARLKYNLAPLSMSDMAAMREDG